MRRLEEEGGRWLRECVRRAEVRAVRTVFLPEQGAPEMRIRRGRALLGGRCWAGDGRVVGGKGETGMTVVVIAVARGIAVGR